MATIEGLGGGMLLSLAICGIFPLYEKFKSDREARERLLVFLVGLAAGGFGLWVLGVWP
jgi:hypothetical protein